MFIGSNNMFMLRVTVKNKDFVQATDVTNVRVLQTAVCVVPLSIGHYTEASSNEI
jgi:hypothetical protein